MVNTTMQKTGLLKQLKSRIKAHWKALRRFCVNTFRSFTAEDLQRALGALGLTAGDTLLVHCSFDAFEGFQGKATDVIAVLQKLVGSGGVVMMPTMTFSGSAVEYARTGAVFDVVRTPSRMGLLTELFRRSPGVVRSVHPTHPVAIWGSDAAEIASGHHLARTPCGAGTPFEALLKRRGKIVLLGTDINVLTFYHALEEFIEHELPVSPFTAEVFHLRSKARDGQMLESDCRLFEPAVSRRRNLRKLMPVLKSARAWHATQVGGLKLAVLAAADVDKAVRGMSQQGIYCYD